MQAYVQSPMADSRDRGSPAVSCFISSDELALSSDYLSRFENVGHYVVGLPPLTALATWKVTGRVFRTMPMFLLNLTRFCFPAQCVFAGAVATYECEKTFAFASIFVIFV